MKDFTSISVRDAAALLSPEPQLKSSPLPYRELLAQQAHTEFYKRRKTLQNVDDNLSSCTPEVTLQGDYHLSDGKILRLRGRIDLLEYRNDAYIIYEFKTIFCKPENIYITEIPPRISMQVRLYAYLFHIGTPTIQPESITCNVVLHNLSDQNDQITTIPWSVSQIEAELKHLSKIVIKQGDKTLKKTKRRKSRADKLSWQFSGYRSGQEDIVEAVEHTFTDGGDLLINAPTGIGKTLAVLLPALKHSLRSGGQLFYATAKGGGRNPAIQAIRMISSDDVSLSAMIMPSQRELCDNYPDGCNALECDYYPESWDISNQIDLPDSHKKTGVLLASDFRSIGEGMNLCPAILAAAASLQADIVIGDYNFVFSPYASLNQFHKAGKSNWTLLIDEAHNLIDRVREEFSFTLQYDVLDGALQLLKDELWLHVDNPVAAKLTEALSAATASFLSVIEELPFEAVGEIDLEQVEWDEHVKTVGMLFAEFLTVNAARLDRDLEKALWKAYITLKNFSEILKRDQDKYLYLGDNDSRVIQLCCLDPSDETHEMYRRFRNITAFSGTLIPLDFYAGAMGFGERALVKLDVPGWYDENRCLITVASGVDTRYHARNAEYSRIAKIIKDFVKYQPGGY
ncbi:MAG: DEAD/DEAH box helicase, partial [Calditrichaeota bacterium]|nr:DEAD/DEAH box helicase [Calditrichota bacterium]